MAERDAEFTQDVLRIIYEALADREALAAAMPGQQPVPVAGVDPQQPGSSRFSGSSPFEVGVQGGNGPNVPPGCPYRCGERLHVDYEDLAFDDLTERKIKAITRKDGVSVTPEQLVQEAMRRTLAPRIHDIWVEFDSPPLPEEEEENPAPAPQQ